MPSRSSSALMLGLLPLLLIALGGAAREAAAQAPPGADSPAARRAAATELDDLLRRLEIVQLKFQLQERVDYALRLRRLRSEIRLTEAEVESYHRRLREYRRFESLDRSPLMLTIENTRLALLEAELRLQDLREERVLLERHLAEQRRLQSLLIEQARQHARRLE